MTAFWDFESVYAWYEDCDNFDLEKKYANIPNVQMLPWWMRQEPNAHPFGIRGWFTDSYPLLHPYYPIANVDPDWIGAWSPFLHDGYWWG